MQRACNYYNNIYQPRSQVKNPQACGKEQCQKLRQRDNERKWHQHNQGLYDKKYHQVKRIVRNNTITSIATQLIEALSIGLRFEGKELCDPLILNQYICTLGIRILNKLWRPLII